MGPLHERSIRRPIAPWANALTTELHLAPSYFMRSLFKINIIIIIVVVIIIICLLICRCCPTCILFYIFHTWTLKLAFFSESELLFFGSNQIWWTVIYDLWPLIYYSEVSFDSYLPLDKVSFEFFSLSVFNYFLILVFKQMWKKNSLLSCVYQCCNKCSSKANVQQREVSRVVTEGKGSLFFLHLKYILVSHQCTVDLPVLPQHTHTRIFSKLS